MDCPLESTQKNCTYIICDVLPLRLLRSIRKNDGVIELQDRKEVAESVRARIKNYSSCTIEISRGLIISGGFAFMVGCAQDY